MQSWSDVSQRPNGLSDTECIGFVNKDSATEGLNLTIDLQAPANATVATLRTWGIYSQPDENGNQRFDNIQLDFAIDYTTARGLTQKGRAATRADLRELLNAPTTQLAQVIVSNQSGRDQVSDQLLGERYDTPLTELDQTGADNIKVAMDAVLGRLKAATVA